MALTNDLYSQFQRNKVNVQTVEAQPANMNVTKPIDKSIAYQQYQNNMVNTASPQELTLMLYNGLIKFLNLSIQGIEEKSIEKSNNYIMRSQDIILEFMSTLDTGYDVSQGLMSLYEYMHRRLIEANIKKDKEIVDEVLKLAEEIRDTWMQAIKLTKQQSLNK